MIADVPSPCDKKGFSVAEGAVSDNRDAPAIDFAHLARQSLDDRALENELLALFENQAARITAQLLALGVGEAKLRADLAHTLKGSALAIGAGRAARSAQAYEAACAAGSQGAALDDLVAAVAQVRAAIAERLARPSSTASPGDAEG
jgi:HPt (histidine-containing phosphotransfer) domain-containing protein